jgi:hypothetical protein
MFSRSAIVRLTTDGLMLAHASALHPDAALWSDAALWGD